MSEAEHPDRLRPGRDVTVDDVRQLMGASTPHFALQLRERIRALIRGLPAGDPARTEGERSPRSPDPPPNPPHIRFRAPTSSGSESRHHHRR